MKSLSPRMPLMLALWFAGVTAASAVVGIVLPEDSGMLRGVVGAIAALSAVGAVACILQARKGAGTPIDPAVFAPLVDAADGARLITGQGGAVIARNADARVWLRDSDILAYISDHLAQDIQDVGGDEAVTRLRHAAERGMAATADVPLLRGAGESAGIDPEWFSISVRPIQGAPGLLLWSAADITARRTITDVLSQERQELADFLFFLPTGLYSVDIDGKITFANQRFAAWLGYSPEELTGLSLDEIIAGPHRPQPDGEWQGEVQFKARGGETFAALVLQSTYDDAGDTRTRTLVIRDGVRREASQAPGRIAFERFRTLFNAAPVAMAPTPKALSPTAIARSRNSPTRPGPASSAPA
jgi:two-component system cell cycle sensor histidine kinase/response regulator CckA